MSGSSAAHREDVPPFPEVRRYDYLTSRSNGQELTGIFRTPSGTPQSPVEGFIGSGHVFRRQMNWQVIIER